MVPNHQFGPPYMSWYMYFRSIIKKKKRRIGLDTKIWINHVNAIQPAPTCILAKVSLEYEALILSKASFLAEVRTVFSEPGQFYA